ncbi:MAG: hypothetical protein F6J98_46985, partial [Moorea sp. SIO4G2]|nr:hypothetical protein [Moorena sp. SIO4G2]
GKLTIEILIYSEIYHTITAIAKFYREKRIWEQGTADMGTGNSGSGNSGSGNSGSGNSGSGNSGSGNSGSGNSGSGNREQRLLKIKY